jgi:hypothetical protein
MERDIRRNMGFGTVFTRLRDRALPYAWVARLGLASIPLFVAGKTLDNWWDCLRCGPAYGLRWHEYPAAFGLAVVLHLMEVPGMVAALRGRELTDTVYR